MPELSSSSSSSSAPRQRRRPGLLLLLLLLRPDSASAGLRRRPGALCPRSPGVTPQPGRPAPRPRRSGAGHRGARSWPGCPRSRRRAARGRGGGQPRSRLCAGAREGAGEDPAPGRGGQTRGSLGPSGVSPPRGRAQGRHAGGGVVGVWHRDARPQLTFETFSWYLTPLPLWWYLNSPLPRAPTSVQCPYPIPLALLRGDILAHIPHVPTSSRKGPHLHPAVGSQSSASPWFWHPLDTVTWILQSRSTPQVRRGHARRALRACTFKDSDTLGN